MSSYTAIGLKYFSRLRSCYSRRTLIVSLFSGVYRLIHCVNFGEETLKYSFLEIELYREVLSMKETLRLFASRRFPFFFRCFQEKSWTSYNKCSELVLSYCHRGKDLVILRKKVLKVDEKWQRAVTLSSFAWWTGNWITFSLFSHHRPACLRSTQFVEIWRQIYQATSDLDVKLVDTELHIEGKNIKFFFDKLTRGCD